MKRGTNPNSLRALKEHGNKNGQRNADAVRFARELRAMLVERGEQPIGKARRKRVEKLIDKVWDLALDGKEWAVAFIAERVEGKVPTPIDANVNAVIDDVSKLTPEERRKRIDELLDRRGRSGTAPLA